MQRILLGSLLWAAGLGGAQSQVIVVPDSPQVGSANPVTAEPLVPRPPGKPCEVKLFSELAFANFNAKIFGYTPPAKCPGPWAKVVFTADFTVQAGNQFDRTAAFYLGHANIYYGTTAEPGAKLSPSWHVERDVTDLSSLLLTAQSGEADLGNFVGTSGGVLYNSIIYANAALEFYPLQGGEAAPATPDLVVPLPDAAGGAATLSSTASQLTQSVTLPRNTERVFLDVIAQSQSGDEFWYTCVPNDVSGELQSCGNTAFRETEVSIDGRAAGVAPVYPWIYTGGIDPFLWQPITGVQTLDFKPYRVDLTPFAGLLADGKPHVFAISVYNADNYFLATANLLVHTDHDTERVAGAVLRDTLGAAPTPVVKEKLTTDSSGNISGTVSVSSTRTYEIAGYVETARGRIETTLTSQVKFENLQHFSIGASKYVQNITQSTSIDTDVARSDGWSTLTTRSKLSYPFELGYAFVTNANGSATQTTSVRQQYGLTAAAKVGSEVLSEDTLDFDAAGNFTGNSAQVGSARYVETDAQGHCYGRSLSAAAGILTAVQNGVDCHGSANTDP
jgi:hypothetical protein